MASSEADMTALLKGFIAIGRTEQWLISKGFPEQQIQKIIIAEKESRARFEAEAIRLDTETRTRAETEGKVRLESVQNASIAAGRSSLEATINVLGETEVSSNAGAELDAKARSEATKSGQGYLGWLRGIPVLSSFYGQAATSSPPISGLGHQHSPYPQYSEPGRPALGKPAFSDRKTPSVRDGLDQRGSPVIGTRLLEHTRFKRHAENMITICKLLKQENESGTGYMQKIEVILAQNKFSKYSNTVDIMFQLFLDAHEGFANILQDKELYRRIELWVNFFTNAKIEAVITALDKEFENMSEPNSTPSSPRKTPVDSPSLSPALSSSGILNISPYLEPSNSPQLPHLSMLDDVVVIQNTNWFQNLLDLIQHKSVTCPDPENVKPIIDMLKTDRRRASKGLLT